MAKTKELIKKAAASPLLIYFGFFCVLLLLYRFMYLNIGDDQTSTNILKDMTVPEAAAYSWQKGHAPYQL